MRRKVYLAVWAVIATAAVPAAADNYGLDEYREALVEEHGPFVAVPTYLGAAVGAVMLFPVSVINGALSLVLFRENPTHVLESWLTAPERGWYWGGLVLGTPFRLLKAVIWDGPAALIRTSRRGIRAMYSKRE